MTSITHLQSSTQIINLNGIKILTDPWLTEGEYYGSWYHYPPFDEKDIHTLEYDYIYVSHIHPDHISAETMRKLPHKKPVLIAEYQTDFLKRKIEAFGYSVIECKNGEEFNIDPETSVTIYAADNCDPKICSRFLGCAMVEKKFGSTQIDSLALFKCGNEVILNTNDCPYELASETITKNKLDELEINVLLVGYAGAGPFPQCFEFESEEARLIAAEQKEKQFITQAAQYIDLLKPKYFIPFAGTYLLGSSLEKLNQYRGVPQINDALAKIEIEKKCDALGVLLNQWDVFEITKGNKISNKKAPAVSYEDYVDKIKKLPLSYINEYVEMSESKLNENLNSAHARFKNKAKEIGFKSKTKIVISTEKRKLIFDSVGISVCLEELEVVAEPYVIIELNDNLLKNLVSGPKFAHWNNAEIGSHLYFRRKPDLYERGLYHCLCFFHV